jgi:hypothetical protein
MEIIPPDYNFKPKPSKKKRLKRISSSLIDPRKQKFRASKHENTILINALSTLPQIRQEAWVPKTLKAAYLPMLPKNDVFLFN